MKRLGIIFLAREPFLTSTQLDKLSDILIAVGQLSVVSMVIPFILPGLDRGKFLMVVLGVFIAFFSWILSIMIVRRLE